MSKGVVSSLGSVHSHCARVYVQQLLSSTQLINISASVTLTKTVAGHLLARCFKPMLFDFVRKLKLSTEFCNLALYVAC
jgi:hypothetical protein